MKMILAVTGCLMLAGSSLFSQETPVATNAPATNAAAGIVITNAADGTVVTNEVTFEDLAKLPAFTNSTGMLMVKVANNLWVSATEVTQEQYQKVAGSNPSKFQGPNNPVESVSWDEAMQFCVKLTLVEAEEKMVPENLVYALPTQAQWEMFAAGADLANAITGSGTRRAGTSPVATLGATGPGVFDIRGNVWEWALDPQDKPFHVARGGAWDTFIEVNLRPEFRWYSKGADDRSEAIGFRCVLEPKQ